MSRIGKQPVPVPAGVEAEIRDAVLEVTGPKGALSRRLRPEVAVEIGEGEIRVRPVAESRRHRAFHGLFRNLIANMVQGVTAGFTRVLEINGVGYRAQVQGGVVEFHLGYSHPIRFPLPEGVTAQIEKNILTLKGIDKEVLGQTAAEIRALRPPEPYKGKGIQYAEEKIRRKAGKTTT